MAFFFFNVAQSLEVYALTRLLSLLPLLFLLSYDTSVVGLPPSLKCGHERKRGLSQKQYGTLLLS